MNEGMEGKESWMEVDGKKVREERGRVIGVREETERERKRE